MIPQGLTMIISKEQLFQAASKLGLSEDNKKALWMALEEETSKDSPMSKLLYYFGALIVISAMTWFMTLGWAVFGGGGIFLISLLYALLFLWIGAKLWKKEELKIPAGLLITMAVCMAPLAIYGLESHFGWFPDENADNYRSFYFIIKSSWIWMEIGTIIAGLVALWFFPFPFLTAPIFFAAWFFSLDITSIVVGKEASFEQKSWVTLAFGVLILLVAYIIDLKKMPQYAFWGYLFGTIAFWGSLTAICFGKGEIALFIYFLINISMMVKSVLLRRKVLLIFGAIGAFSYLSHLAYDLFENSILFPFALSAIGLIVIYLGVLYQKNREVIETKIRNFLPRGLKKLLP
jgi:hypothetical protein